MYFGRQRSLAETLLGIEGVKRSSVQAVARRLVGNRTLTVAAVGPLRRLPVELRELVL
jgi:predicted Zn-dependent peptidase